MEMTPTEIILAIISSSVISSIVVSYVNWRIHNSSYKNDYYKRIIDKRIEAYDAVQGVSRALCQYTQLNDAVIPSVCFSDKLNFQFLVILRDALNMSHWINDETSEKLTELSTFNLNYISNEVPKDISETEFEDRYQKLGRQYVDEFRKFRYDIDELVSKDLKKLHEIDSFLSRKKR